MMNLVCILIMIVGGLNWASIGFLQYDFIAGFFGTQASIFSRLIYICVGLATLYFIFMMFKYRGNIKVVDRQGNPKRQASEVYFQGNQQQPNLYNQHGYIKMPSKKPNNNDNNNDILS